MRFCLRAILCLESALSNLNGLLWHHPSKHKPLSKWWFSPVSKGIVFRRQNLTSVDVRFWRLKTSLHWKNIQWHYYRYSNKAEKNIFVYKSGFITDTWQWVIVSVSWHDDTVCHVYQDTALIRREASPETPPPPPLSRMQAPRHGARCYIYIYTGYLWKWTTYQTRAWRACVHSLSDAETSTQSTADIVTLSDSDITHSWHSGSGRDRLYCESTLGQLESAVWHKRCTFSSQKHTDI